MTVIEGEGTPESHWLPWLARTRLPPAELPAPGSGTQRALVVAGHPDDEVLGAGGLLHLLARHGWQVDVVWASDGEASHPGSTATSRADLARRRRLESAAARLELGLSGSTTWLALPDSGLGPHEGAVTDAVTGLAEGADLLVATWHQDGHPDHEVCGRAALAAGRDRGVAVWEVPIWAWHWGRADELADRWGHARTVELDEAARTAKAAAVAQFLSQVRPLGPDAADRAVLGPHVLARFCRPFEVVLCTDPQAPTTATGGRP